MQDLSARGALALLLSSSVLIATPTLAQDSRSDDGGNIEAVVVTGSRIPRAAREGATSLSVISATDLERNGYRNVFDALNQQTQNTGFTQGADYGNTFTPAANTISLRGLGPNHALILINGRRVADYPTAYDGEVNFVNLANIPSAAIERIETLNSGASAIYGSDAIAGVVNIILKDRIDGVNLNLKTGTTERGGGDNARLQLSAGGEFGGWRLRFAAEVSETDPIWSADRDFMSSETLQGTAPTLIWGRLNVDTNRYIAPADRCAAFVGLFDDSIAFGTTRQGSFCASGKARPLHWTTQTGNKSQNLFGAATFDIDDTTQFFAEVIAGFNQTENNTRGPIWNSLAGNGDYFFNRNTGDYELWRRRISPEEIGGATRYNRNWQDRSGSVALGVRGDLAGSWKYEAVYNASGYESHNTVPRLTSAIDSFFLGPRLGADADGIAIYAPDAARFGQPLTPDQFTTFFTRTRNDSTSWLQNVSFGANGEIVDLPAGPLRAAAQIEWGSQGFSIEPDDRLHTAGNFFNTNLAQDVDGSRQRYAASVEFNVPIVEQVEATLAGRYDDYSFAGRSDGKFTYNAGLQYRPVRGVLLRGNYATSFRAPDMNYIFQTEVRGYYESTTDYYRCRIEGQPLSRCDYANIAPGSNYIQAGSKDLQFENGRSFGYGIVWSPSSNFDVSVDYWHIEIDDLVTNLSADQLLRNEADCRTGARDIASSECVDALRRIVRNPPEAALNPNAISVILVNPINASLRETNGYDVATKWQWTWGASNQFVWNARFTKVLRHRYQQFSTDAERDLLRSFENPDWQDKLITDLSWANGNWGSTLQLTRYGKIPNQAQDAYLTPTTLANISVDYRFSERASAAIIVQNVADKIKRDDSAGWPFYPVGSYFPYGRQGWLSFNYHFGS